MGFPSVNIPRRIEHAGAQVTLDCFEVTMARAQWANQIPCGYSAVLLCLALCLGMLLHYDVYTQHDY